MGVWPDVLAAPGGGETLPPRRRVLAKAGVLSHSPEQPGTPTNGDRMEPLGSVKEELAGQAL